MNRREAKLILQAHGIPCGFGITYYADNGYVKLEPDPDPNQPRSRHIACLVLESKNTTSAVRRLARQAEKNSDHS